MNEVAPTAENLEPAFSEDSRGGLVYLLVRPTNKSIVKVGFTTKTAESRALNYTDGGWIVDNEYPMPVWLARLTEKAAHQKLSNYWLDPGLTNGSASEIFTCSVEIADTAIKIAYIEQLEASLKSLRIPEVIVSIILKNSTISDLQSPDSTRTDLESLLKKAAQETDEVKNQLKQAERYFAQTESNLKQQISELKQLLNRKDLEIEKITTSSENQRKADLKKIMEAEKQIEQIKQLIHDALGHCRQEIKAIERYSRKKISPRDFESLKDHFSRSLNVISRLKLIDI
jgi:T5orf172 domain